MRHLITLVLIGLGALVNAQHCGWDGVLGKYIGFKNQNGDVVHLKGHLVFLNEHGDTLSNLGRKLKINGAGQTSDFTFDTKSARNMCSAEVRQPVIEDVISMYPASMTGFRPTKMHVVLGPDQNYEFEGYRRFYSFDLDVNTLVNLCTGVTPWDGVNGADSLRSRIDWVTVYSKKEAFGFYVGSSMDIERLMPGTEMMDAPGLSEKMEEFTTEMFDTSGYLVVFARKSYREEEWVHSKLLRGPLVLFYVSRTVDTMKQKPNKGQKNPENVIHVFPVESQENSGETIVTVADTTFLD